MFKDLDVVRIKTIGLHTINGTEIPVGAYGTVVYIWKNGTYEVEFPGIGLGSEPFCEKDLEVFIAEKNTPDR